MSSSMLLYALLIAAVFFCAGALIMTLINLGYYFNPRRGRPDSARRAGADVPRSPPLVAVCVPARNEEANIEACVRGVLAGDHARVEVVVYDDQSTDATPQILRALREEDPRVVLAPTAALPDGWVGKQWACQQLGITAMQRGAEWMLFTDADVRFEPGAVRSALDAARMLDASMVSTFPRQITGSLAEHVLIPMIHFVLFSYLPMGQMRGGNAPSASAGCGQFLFISRDAYEACGGHEAWKNSMHDGIRMPRAVRRAGLHTDLFDGTATVSCRMYRGLAQTWRGFVKNAYEGLGSVGLLLFITVIHAIGHVFPWVVLIGAVFVEPWRGPAAVLAASAILIAFAQRLILARHFKQSLLGAALHPLGILGMAGIQWHSFVNHLRGVRAWKGRSVDARAA